MAACALTPLPLSVLKLKPKSFLCMLLSLCGEKYLFIRVQYSLPKASTIHIFNLHLLMSLMVQTWRLLLRHTVAVSSRRVVVSVFQPAALLFWLAAFKAIENCRKISKYLLYWTHPGWTDKLALEPEHNTVLSS